MSSAVQREALTNTLTRAGHAIECWVGQCSRHLLCPLGALKSWKDGESHDRVSAAHKEEKRGRIYTCEGGQGMQPATEREREGVVHCLLLQVRCLSRARTGLSWTIAAWTTTHPSMGLKAVWMEPGQL